MTNFPSDPGAYRVLTQRANRGRGALDAVTIMAGGAILAEYDGDNVDTIVKLARDEERCDPAALPSDRAMILAAMRDNGIAIDGEG